MKIETVVIRFTRQIFSDNPTVYQAVVRTSPIQLRSGPFSADVETQMATFRTLFMQRIIADHRYTSSPTDIDGEAEKAALDLAELGEQLYRLLPEALRQGLPELVQHVFDKGGRMRLIFEARAGDQADQLLSMPWEILYFKQLKAHLGRMPRVTIERRLIETVRQAIPKLDPPFHIAHVIAEARDYDPIAPDLVAAERAAVQQAANSAEAYTLVAEPGSVDKLLVQLRQKPYQIIHFLGHGIVDRHAAQSYLVFAGEHNAPQLVAAEQMPNLLSSAHETRIMVLNACHGASVEATNTVALQLVYYGLPYVVAMQGEIFQKSAVSFARAFYAAVQANKPLEEAVALSRQAIATEVPGSIDWALPALYVSAGIEEAPVPERVLSAIERWLSQSPGQRQLAHFTIGMGVAHLIVGCLLLLSGVTLVLPDLTLIFWIIGVIAPFPPLIAVAARWFAHVPLPAAPALSFVDQVNLLLRMFSAASLTVLVQSEMGAVNVGGSLQTTATSIQALRPQSIIMVGIAFGIDPVRQRIGDILIARQILDYELQRVGTDSNGELQIRSRGDRPACSPRLLDRFRSGAIDWNGAHLHFGLMFSGSKLIDQQDFRDQLRRLEPEAIGGEMEGMGLYAAAQHAKIDWILIKAICDYADGQKSLDKENRQRIAAKNAAQFVLHVIGQGGFATNLAGQSLPMALNEPKDRIPDNLTHPSRFALQRVLDHYFNASELQTLCFELGIDHEQLAGANKSDKVRELITYAERHGRIGELELRCRQLRPHANW
jgi:nucleoside phosphorylase